MGFFFISPIYFLAPATQATKEVKVFSKGVESLAVWVLVNYMLYSLCYRTLVGVKVPSLDSKSLKNVRFVI